MYPAKFTTAAILLAALTASAAAQTAPAQQDSRPRGRPDPAALREQLIARFRDALNCSDDEWKVLEPKVIKILLLQMDLGQFGVPPGTPRAALINNFIRNIIDPNADPSEVAEKIADLQHAIDTNESSTDAYKNLVAQLRKAREKAQKDLEATQKDLAADLSVRQEATLVTMGLLN